MTGTKSIIENSGRKIAEVTHADRIHLRRWVPLATADRYSDEAIETRPVAMDRFVGMERKAVAVDTGDPPLVIKQSPRTRPEAPRRLSPERHKTVPVAMPDLTLPDGW